MEPMLLSLKDAVAFSGFSRSRIYSLIGQGKIQARKAGRRTLVETASLTRLAESLPPVRIGAAALPEAERDAA